MQRYGRGPTMSQFLDGLSNGRSWAWLLTATLALIALAILIKGLDDRKARQPDPGDPDAQRWLNDL